MVGWFGIVLSLFVGSSTLFHLEFNHAVPKAYADETCHFKQVKYYCNGSFDKWNEVITTLPGLYFFSVGTLKPVSWALGLVDDCSIFLLRSLSLFSSFGVLGLLHAIISIRNPEVSECRRGLSSLTLAFFPMLYFYYFKYYTETLSILLLLAMHHSHLKGANVGAAVYGALSVFTRQTNIIWVLWHALLTGWKWLDQDMGGVEKNWLGRVVWARDRVRKGDAGGVLEEGCRLGGGVLKETVPYAVIGLAFAVFVVLNDGIVVGDRTNHTACLNLPQVLYFGLYSLCFLCPVAVPRLGSTVGVLRRRGLVTAGAVGLGLAVVHFKTMMHWYLLTDSSHYIHYIGSALYVWYPGLKYALVPLYVLAWTWIWRNLELDGVRKAFLLLAIALSVVPQLLMEFRYFVPGFVFIRLHLKAFGWRDMGGELLLYAIINYLTLTQYMYAPYMTAKGEERLMW